MTTTSLNDYNINIKNRHKKQLYSNFYHDVIMTTKIKPTSIRLGSELLEEIDSECSAIGCSRNDRIKDILDSYFEEKELEAEEKEVEEEKKEEEPKIIVEDIPKPVMSKITSIDGIPIEKFQSGEYYIQDSKVVKRQELGIIEKLIDEITN